MLASSLYLSERRPTMNSPIEETKTRTSVVIQQQSESTIEQLKPATTLKKKKKKKTDRHSKPTKRSGDYMLQPPKRKGSMDNVENLLQVLPQTQRTSNVSMHDDDDDDDDVEGIPLSSPPPPLRHHHYPRRRYRTERRPSLSRSIRQSSSISPKSAKAEEEDKDHQNDPDPVFVSRRISRSVSLDTERPSMRKTTLVGGATRSMRRIDGPILRPYRQLSIENLCIGEETESADQDYDDPAPNETFPYIVAGVATATATAPTTTSTADGAVLPLIPPPPPLFSSSDYISHFDKIQLSSPQHSKHKRRSSNDDDSNNFTKTYDKQQKRSLSHFRKDGGRGRMIKCRSLPTSLLLVSAGHPSIRKLSLDNIYNDDYDDDDNHNDNDNLFVC